MDFTSLANSMTTPHAIPPAHPYSLQPSPFPSHLPVCDFLSLSLPTYIHMYLMLFRLWEFFFFFCNFQILRRSGLVKNRLIARCSSKSDEFGSVNGLQSTPNKLFMEEVSILLIFLLILKCSKFILSVFSPNVLHLNWD